MSTAKQDLINTIEEIINNELTVYDQTQFTIEGRDLLEQQLSPKQTGTAEAEPDNFRFGFTDQQLDAFKVFTPVGSLIVSCLTFLLNLRKDKNISVKLEMERIEYIEKLLAIMKEQQLDPALIETVKQKYADRILACVDRLVKD